MIEIESEVRYNLYMRGRRQQKVKFHISGDSQRFLPEIKRVIEYGDGALIIANSSIHYITDEAISLWEGKRVDLSKEKVIITELTYKWWFLFQFDAFIKMLNSHGVFITVREEL